MVLGRRPRYDNWLSSRVMFPAIVIAALGVAACGGGSNSSQSSLVSEGSAAPDFMLPAASGNAARLSDYAGQENVLLYFSMGSG